jgi:hypothetical protein
MKATITSTSECAKVQGVLTRVWEGVSEAGVEFTAYIALVKVPRNADNSQFERELSEHTFEDIRIEEIS